MCNFSNRNCENMQHHSFENENDFQAKRCDNCVNTVGCIDVDSSLEMKVNIMYLTTSFHVVATSIQLVFAQ